jgi:hypothetical protein
VFYFHPGPFLVAGPIFITQGKQVAGVPDLLVMELLDSPGMLHLSLQHTGYRCTMGAILYRQKKFTLTKMANGSI